MALAESKVPEIIYEDNDLILVNKPAGLLSIQDGYNPNLPHIKSIFEPEYNSLWIVHRLDKDTSGIMLLARNAETHRKLNKAFRQRQIKKIYHGLVIPPPTWHQKEVDLPLRVNADRKHRTRVDPVNGKPASSTFLIVKWFPLGVLMTIRIESGITHQIRAHLRTLELSLLGDSLYQAGLPEQPIMVKRTMLHAREIGFFHPISTNWMQFTANYPADFRAAYTKLRITKETDLMI